MIVIDTHQKIETKTSERRMWYTTNILTLLSVLAILASATIYQQAVAVNLQEGYKELGEFFDGIDRGLDVKRYLGLANSELKWQNFKDLLKIHSSNSDYKAALKEIIELRLILYRTKCDTDEYYLLKKIEERVGDGHRYFDEYETARMKPLVFIVHEVSEIRARKCKRVWPKKFAEAYAEFNTTAAKLAEFKHIPLRQTREYFRDDYKYIEYILDYQLEKDPKGVNHAYIHLMRHSRVENYPQRCEFHSIIDKYLRVPCQQYEKELGFPILFQARYDGKMFSRYSNEIAMDRSMILFYEAMLSDVICKVILDTGSNFSKRFYEFWFEIERKQRSDCYQLLKKEEAARRLAGLTTDSATSLTRGSSGEPSTSAN